MYLHHDPAYNACASACWPTGCLLLQVWLGYRQSLRPCENGLTLNIDVAATAFLAPQPVLRFLSNIVRKREELLTLQDRTELRKAQKAIFGLKVGLLPSSLLFPAQICGAGQA